MTSLGKRRPSGPASDRTIFASEASNPDRCAHLRPLDFFVASLLEMTVQRVQERLFR
jgi:hypothetical protein